MSDYKQNTEQLKKILVGSNYPARAKRNTFAFLEAVAEALTGKLVMWATPKGNVMLVEEMKFQSLTTTPSHNEIKREALDWATGDDTGVSSKALMRYMLGLSPNKWGYSAPSDADDRGRCIRLLKIMPEWLERLDEMVQFSGWEKQIPLIKSEYLTQSKEGGGR